MKRRDYKSTFFELIHPSKTKIVFGIFDIAFFLLESFLSSRFFVGYKAVESVEFPQVQNDDVYEAFYSIFSSDSVCQRSYERLLSEGTLHSDGSEISKKEIVDHIGCSYPEGSYLIELSFWATDPSIVSRVLSIQTSVTIDEAVSKDPNSYSDFELIGPAFSKIKKEGSYYLFGALGAVAVFAIYLYFFSGYNTNKIVILPSPDFSSGKAKGVKKNG